MKIQRSKGMVLAGYFLARCGVKTDGRRLLPPAALGTTSWHKAYAMFYKQLSNGRDSQSFENSLRNVRDAFDAYLDKGRKGWHEPPSQTTVTTRKAARLPSLHQNIFDTWCSRDDDKLWLEIRSLISAR